MLKIRALTEQVSGALREVEQAPLIADFAHAIRSIFEQSAAASDEAVSSLKQKEKSREEQKDAFYSSVVVEYTVPEGKGWAFRKWHSRLVDMARRSPGFVRADRHRPLRCKDGALKWYSVIHFDQPEHLDRWLSSDHRETVLKAGKSVFDGYKFKSFTTGLEGWFFPESGLELNSLGPPAWKQILSVVLGLYPIIMIQERLFSYLGVFESWTPAKAMLANNLITTCILTLVVMPLIIRLLGFWFKPAYQSSSLRSEVSGTILTVAAMGLMALLFERV